MSAPVAADDTRQLLPGQADLGDWEAIAQQDGHHLSEALHQSGVGVDIDAGEWQLRRNQHLGHLVTQMAALTGHQLEAHARVAAYSHSMVPGGLLVMS